MALKIFNISITLLGLRSTFVMSSFEGCISCQKQQKKKKKSQQNPPKDPLGHQIWFYTKKSGAGLPYVDFKNRSTG